MSRLFVWTEEQGDAPKTRQTDESIDDAGENRHLSAAEKCHGVKAEQTDAAPVQSSDNGQDQCELVKKHLKTSIRAIRQGFADIFPVRTKNYTKPMRPVQFQRIFKWNCNQQRNLLQSNAKNAGGESGGKKENLS